MSHKVVVFAADHRESVAALLNSVNTSVDYFYSSSQVVSALRAAVQNGGASFESEPFEVENTKGCPLGRAK